MPQLTLADIGERGLIRQILKPLKNKKGYIVSPGDDAAVLRHPKGLVLSIDGITEGVHFKSSWSSSVARLGFSFGRALGLKAMGSALSDLAAMGDVQDRFALVFLGAPGSTPVALLKDFQKGVLTQLQRYNVRLAGGDTVKSRVLTVSVMVGGNLKSRPLTRQGVKSGDFLCVTGVVGEAAMGLRVLNGHHKNISPAQKNKFVSAFFDHKPLFREGKILSSAPGVHSLIDLSDSISESIQLLLGRSGLNIDVNVNSLPTSLLRDRILKPNASLLGGGEDYALMFSADAAAVKYLHRKLPFSVLGQFKKKTGGVRYFIKGRPIKSPRAFKHF